MASKAVNVLRSELEVITGQIKEMQQEHDGQEFPDDVLERWNRLNSTADDYRKKIELKMREERIEELTRDDSNIESGEFSFNTDPVNKIRDPFDLSTIDRSDLEKELKGYKERSKVVIERSEFPHAPRMREQFQGHLERLVSEEDGENAVISRHMLITGRPAYKRAFGKHLLGQMMTGEEMDALRSADVLRALSLTGSAGGFAVPFELDPTIIPTSNLAVNPFRAVARIEQVTVDEWRGVSAGAITAAYAAEATAASDNAPTLAQPTISTEKAQAFVPYSIEVGMDWNGLQAEMGRLLADAKDELEATKFATGSGTNEPQGVLTGATTVYTASGTASFAVADLYGLEAALPPRFRPNASLVMNRAIAQRIRQFDTAGGANIWIDNLRLGLDNQVPTPGRYGSAVLGYSSFESSAMASALTTGNLIAVLGDFRYYVIVDRIGLTIETIPHLFDVTNNRPTGQRGLYAYWRNGAGVVSAAAFRVLKTG
jgi:HK97 family phage major capsid protein